MREREDGSNFGGEKREKKRGSNFIFVDNIFINFFEGENVR